MNIFFEVRYMECPKSVFIATFLYLNRLYNENKLILDKKAEKNIISNIEKVFDEYIADIVSQERKSKKLPHERPKSVISTKGNLEIINLIKELGEQVVKNDKVNYPIAKDDWVVHID